MSKFSVIMTVYDQARELESQLPAFLTQDYEPGYEVIVVDESSTDDTEDVLNLLKQSHPHLYTTFLPKPNRNITRYKLALTIGVKAAKNEWVILSDINRAPATMEWLKEIAETMDNSAEAMLGYVGKKGMQLEIFGDVDESYRYVRKAERKRADGHRGKRMKYLRGKYDFIVVRREKAHDILKFFEHEIGWRRLLGLRLSVICHHL